MSWSWGCVYIRHILNSTAAIFFFHTHICACGFFTHTCVWQITTQSRVWVWWMRHTHVWACSMCHTHVWACSMCHIHVWQIPLKMPHPRNEPNRETRIPRYKFKLSQNLNLNVYRKIPRNLRFSVWCVGDAAFWVESVIQRDLKKQARLAFAEVVTSLIPIHVYLCLWGGKGGVEPKKKNRTSPLSRSRHVMMSNSLGLPVGGMDMPVMTCVLFVFCVCNFGILCMQLSCIFICILYYILCVVSHMVRISYGACHVVELVGVAHRWIGHACYDVCICFCFVYINIVYCVCNYCVFEYVSYTTYCMWYLIWCMPCRRARWGCPLVAWTCLLCVYCYYFLYVIIVIIVYCICNYCVFECVSCTTYCMWYLIWCMPSCRTRWGCPLLE